MVTALIGTYGGMLSPASRRTRASSGKERTDVEIGFVEVLFDGRHLRLARPGWGHQRAVGLSARFFRGRLGMGSRGRRHVPAHVWLRSWPIVRAAWKFYSSGIRQAKTMAAENPFYRNRADCSEKIELPKLHTRVRFPSPAPTLSQKYSDIWHDFSALVSSGLITSAIHR